jgi:hypothetical protein
VCSVRGLYRAFPPPDPPVYVRPQLKPSHGICSFTTTTFGAHRGADQGAGRSTSERDLLHLLRGSTSASPPSTAGPLHLPGLGRVGLRQADPPGWAAPPRHGPPGSLPWWAALPLCPGWAGSLSPRLGRQAGVSPRPVRPRIRPGRRLSSRPGRPFRQVDPGRHLQQAGVAPQAGVCPGRHSWARPDSHMPAGLAPVWYSGRAGPGQPSQARLLLVRPSYPSPGRVNSFGGRDLLYPDHFLHPASTPAPGASPGMPLGSDGHILHRHMLVLGRPLAQTSILLLS